MRHTAVNLLMEAGSATPTCPAINGMQLHGEIKQGATLRDIPVLILMTNARKADIPQAASLGAAGYLLKPFTRPVPESKMLLILSKPGNWRVAGGLCAG